MKRNDAITYRSAVLPNHVPGPVFLRRISASWRLAHPLRGRGLLFRNCIKLDGHSVFKSGSISGDIPEKQKKDHDIIRPITENVPCGRSYRNPSNITSILAFLNVRLQCNIRGEESQRSAETASNSLHSVHFRCLTSVYKKVTIQLTIPIGIENYKKHLRLLRRTII